jgi:putative DNA primase/helicase
MKPADANDVFREYGPEGAGRKIEIINVKGSARGRKPANDEPKQSAKASVEPDHEPNAGANTGDEECGSAPQFTEEGLALKFVAKYRDRLRYVKPWNAWMEYDGARWRQEDTLLAYDLIRKECRAVAAKAKPGSKRNSELNKAKVRGAVETLSRSDRRIASTTDQWDADDWILNTPGGIIDLRTGENIGHDSSRFCTKITAVAPHGDCPLWKTFLKKVTGENEELQAYLQRMCGYFLTGSIREHALFFIYGSGGNGKGLFLNTVSAIWSMYHVVSPAETFAEQRNHRHETELARLKGARIVISQETEQGQYWAEARIKSLTGGDRIAARFMRGDFFEYDPKFKLCIVGNHKP